MQNDQERGHSTGSHLVTNRKQMAQPLMESWGVADLSPIDEQYIESEKVNKVLN